MLMIWISIHGFHTLNGIYLNLIKLCWLSVESDEFWKYHCTMIIEVIVLHLSFNHNEQPYSSRKSCTMNDQWKKVINQSRFIQEVFIEFCSEFSWNKNVNK